MNIISTGGHFIHISWNKNLENNILGYRMYLNGVYQGFTKTPQYTFHHLEANTNYQITITAYNDGYIESPQSATLSATTLQSDLWSKDLMITKVIEGSANNKAFEITNNTGYTVDLRDYTLAIQYQNQDSGSFYTSNRLLLEGTLENGKTIVLINPKANFPNYTYQPSKDLVTAASPLTFTGKESVSLYYKGQYIEQIGYYDQSVNYGENTSLYRNSSVKHPNPNFTPSEWTTHPMDYTEGLGELVLSTEEIVPSSKIQVYPNPVYNGRIFVKTLYAHLIKSAKIYNTSGNLILEFNYPFKNQDYIDISQLQSGFYILEINQETFKIIKK
ncbi:T9SS type A sorting domain-containing protein [Elizabethkingia sp. JS20170427COW]|uniref:lamin tail domain-containing protein n=1 Tax=Elizabethkingia sp. JS20170427COW TaxID=2583851 RepID=UPI001110497C|nr:T9SS type A sorting domain-containing protein [Elizabethkingia sp. JS20170427COW]QCX53958.1 T9SS type A sorting domain-containing protein [Elizabethkingia sp. JS20170427COW]